MFGLFKGKFGTGAQGKVFEAAAEMCAINELEEEDRAQARQQQWRQFVRLVQEMKQLCLRMEKEAGVARRLSMEELLPTYLTYLFYDTLRRSSLTDAEQCRCMDTLVRMGADAWMSGEEIMGHIRSGNDIGQLILAMEKMPLVIMDLATRTGGKAVGTQYLNLLRDLMLQIGTVCDQEWPGRGLTVAARRSGIAQMDYMLELSKQ